MPISIQRGERVSGDRLSIMVLDQVGAPIVPFSISYSVYDKTADLPYLYGDDRREAIRGTRMGQYFSDFSIPNDANIGVWEIRWYIKQFETSTENTVVEEFYVVGAPSILFGWESRLPYYVQTLIAQLRLFLGDDNPDRRYHFRPPETAKVVQGYTERFGYIWDSQQLLAALKFAVNDINLYPPRTWFTLNHFQDGQQAQDWILLLTYKAAAIACRMVQLVWIADEFNYSLGSVSLDLEKSSKYDQIATAYETQFERAIERAKATLNYVLGIRNPRFSGVSGLFSFGPSIGRVGLVNWPNVMRGR